jgi:hypothetical protein
MFVGWPTRQGRRHGLVEKWDGEVSQVEKARLDFRAITKVLEDPLGRLFGKSTLPCAAQNY